MYYFVLFLSVISGTLAQLTLKMGVRDMEFLQVASFFQKLPFLFNGRILIALFFYGASFFLYSLALSKFEVNRAYPISVVSAVILISVLSSLFLHETTSVLKVTGIIICLFGMTMIIKG